MSYARGQNRPPTSEESTSQECKTDRFHFLLFIRKFKLLYSNFLLNLLIFTQIKDQHYRGERKIDHVLAQNRPHISAKSTAHERRIDIVGAQKPTVFALFIRKLKLLYSNFLLKFLIPPWIKDQHYRGECKIDHVRAQNRPTSAEWINFTCYFS